MKEKKEALKKAQQKAEADVRAAAENLEKLTSAMSEKEKLVKELSGTTETLLQTEERLIATTKQKDSDLSAALMKIEDAEGT